MSASKKPSATAFGVFQHPTDESITFIAESVDTANRLVFDGWQRVADPEPDNDWQAQAVAEQEKAQD